MQGAPRIGSRDVASAAKITAAAIGVLALAVGLWYSRTAILLAFAGILLAIVLYGASRALADRTNRSVGTRAPALRDRSDASTSW